MDEILLMVLKGAISAEAILGILLGYQLIFVKQWTPKPLFQRTRQWHREHGLSGLITVGFAPLVVDLVCFLPAVLTFTRREPRLDVVEKGLESVKDQALTREEYGAVQQQFNSSVENALKVFAQKTEEQDRLLLVLLSDVQKVKQSLPARTETFNKLDNRLFQAESMLGKTSRILESLECSIKNLQKRLQDEIDISSSVDRSHAKTIEEIKKLISSIKESTPNHEEVADLDEKIQESNDCLASALKQIIGLEDKVSVLKQELTNKENSFDVTKISVDSLKKAIGRISGILDCGQTGEALIDRLEAVEKSLLKAHGHIGSHNVRLGDVEKSVFADDLKIVSSRKKTEPAVNTETESEKKLEESKPSGTFSSRLSRFRIETSRTVPTGVVKPSSKGYWLPFSGTGAAVNELGERIGQLHTEVLGGSLVAPRVGLGHQVYSNYGYIPPYLYSNYPMVQPRLVRTYMDLVRASVLSGSFSILMLRYSNKFDDYTKDENCQFGWLVDMTSIYRLGSEPEEYEDFLFTLRREAERFNVYRFGSEETNAIKSLRLGLSQPVPHAYLYRYYAVEDAHCYFDPREKILIDHTDELAVSKLKNWYHHILDREVSLGRIPAWEKPKYCI